MMNSAMFRAMALRGQPMQRPVGGMVPQQVPQQPMGGMAPPIGNMMPPQAPQPFRNPVGPSMAPPNNFMPQNLQGFGMGNRGGY